MTRRLSTLLALGLVLAVAACGRPSRPRDPFVPLLAHTDSMIKILQQNEADPDKALQALSAYREQHQGEIEKLKQDVGELMQKDPMKVAPASAIYGMKSAQLDSMAAQLAAKRKAP